MGRRPRKTMKKGGSASLVGVLNNPNVNADAIATAAANAPATATAPTPLPPNFHNVKSWMTHGGGRRKRRRTTRKHCRKTRSFFGLSW